MSIGRVPTKYLSKDSTGLLRAASETRSGGDVNEAIRILRGAYEVMDIEQGCGLSPLLRFGPEPFLRLPMYLQEAGRSEVAWRAFTRLKARCARELPAQNLPLFDSAIEEKQGQYLQREGRHDEAIQYFILSMVSRARGMYLQRKLSALERYRSREQTKKRLLPILEVSDCLEALDPVVEVAMTEMAAVSESPPERMRLAVMGALNR